jgi:hypothetical protein
MSPRPGLPLPNPADLTLRSLPEGDGPIDGTPTVGLSHMPRTGGPASQLPSIDVSPSCGKTSVSLCGHGDEPVTDADFPAGALWPIRRTAVRPDMPIYAGIAAECRRCRALFCDL